VEHVVQLDLCCISATPTLKSIYFAYFYTLIKYGIIFWSNLSDSKKVLTLQKKFVRIMMGVKPRNSCRDLFKRLEILTLPCEYIFSLLNFITNNEEHFQNIANVYSVNTKYRHYLHKQTANLSCFQKSAYYAGIKIFSNLPCELRSRMNEKALFKTALKQYLHTHTFTLLMNTHYLKSDSSI
jgi:hypothetical protein